MRTRNRMTPYLLGFALFCAIVSIGLLHRRLWMWYLGWVIFYLFSAYFGNWFFTALYFAPDYRCVAFSLVYLLGGLVLWLPSILWWSRKRSAFEKKEPRPKGTGQQRFET